MRILYLLLFSLLACQCESDIELIAMEDEKINIENITSADLIEKDIPLNWPWRGINIKSNDTVGVNEEKIKEIKTLGVNALRIIVNSRAFSIENGLNIEEGVVQNLAWCEKVIQWCAKEGIVVIIETIDYPLDPLKKFERWSTEFWESDIELNDALSYINRLVSTFDKYENVVAYGFFSEPVVAINGAGVRPENWFDFFDKILETIRIHSNKYVVFTPGPAGFPNGYSDFAEPINDDKIIYGFHYYLPFNYSHQRIGTRSGFFGYPGLISNKYWDINTIQESINPAVNWAREHNKLLYVGEFSVVRWAEGKEQYLEDVLNVFEENEISYTYWILNEWNGWNMDFEPIRSGNTELIKPLDKTQTREILENFWQKNNE